MQNDFPHTNEEKKEKSSEQLSLTKAKKLDRGNQLERKKFGKQEHEQTLNNFAKKKKSITNWVKEAEKEMQLSPKLFESQLVKISKELSLKARTLNKKTIESIRFEDPKLSQILNATDIWQGRYEGGMKVWECSVDLCTYLISHPIFVEKQLSVSKPLNIAEIGCGHGLPAITLLKLLQQMEGIDKTISVNWNVTFQDLNVDVLKHCSLANLLLNDIQVPGHCDDTLTEGGKPSHKDAKQIHFVSGNWNDASLKDAMLQVLSPSKGDKHKYDIIVTSETIYSLDNFDIFTQLILDLLDQTYGVCLVCAKAYYFGDDLGGGVQEYLSFLLNDDRFNKLVDACVVTRVDDQMSNIREILLLYYRNSQFAELWKKMDIEQED
ncbi:hypothetical protein RFI_20500 [Reticulomyxa filosa]|uniref:protein-histidine N-methyltransferase n=1 Tax=Reticulomyxa filosa TaxID=46433 RepID=X6MS85_RETFI|nr:hypothetical protein RFI_20500 [Reticulomyxa filosa]|eukprot:ETO16838.1 hypothetical protein RFI_20500 [Reticulomyxa filosa]